MSFRARHHPLLGACHCCQPRPRRWHRPLRLWKDDRGGRRGAWRAPAGQGRRAPPTGTVGTRNCALAPGPG
eukprot:2755208-Prorocentrum_lima.AAC.1